MNILIVTICFMLAAIAKALSDGIQWSDLFAHIPFLNRLKTGEKDKNRDGKVSFREKYFPFDGWHLSEWIRIIPFSIAVVLLLQIPGSFTSLLTGYSWLVKPVLVIGLTALYNLVFIVSYNLLPKLK